GLPFAPLFSCFEDPADFVRLGAAVVRRRLEPPRFIATPRSTGQGALVCNLDGSVACLCRRVAGSRALESVFVHNSAGDPSRGYPTSLKLALEQADAAKIRSRRDEFQGMVSLILEGRRRRLDDLSLDHESTGRGDLIPWSGHLGCESDR